MSNKEPEWFISSLYWSFIFVGVILLSLGVYCFIYYSEMDFTGKISSGFSFLSSLGIFATIGVYLHQKKRDKEKQKEKDDIISRNIESTIKDHLTAIENIVCFYRSNLADDIFGYRVEVWGDGVRAVYSLGVDGILLNCCLVNINDGRLIKESMLNRYIASSKIVRVIEETNYIHNLTCTYIINGLIDKLSRDNFPCHLKKSILKTFCDEISNNLINKINGIKKQLD